jgi:hypothetical protein
LGNCFDCNCEAKAKNNFTQEYALVIKFSWTVVWIMNVPQRPMCWNRVENRRWNLVEMHKLWSQIDSGINNHSVSCWLYDSGQVISPNLNHLIRKMGVKLLHFKVSVRITCVCVCVCIPPSMYLSIYIINTYFYYCLVRILGRWPLSQFKECSYFFLLMIVLYWGQKEFFNLRKCNTDASTLP